jgi:hypothetical protein
MSAVSSVFDPSKFISYARAQMGDLQACGTLAHEFSAQAGQTGPTNYPNFWQIGCVFDTILDYFLALKEVGQLEDEDKTLLTQLMLQAVKGFQYGIVGLAAAWYDDWCWWGIAASKSFDADYEDIFGDQLEFFQTAALDLWGLVDSGDFATLADRIPADVWANSALMCDGTRFSSQILSDRSQLHIGAPHAWDLILRGATERGTDRQQADYKAFTSEAEWAMPRFPAGGCWQYDMSTDEFPPDDGPNWLNPNPKDQTLGVSQVTLMSGLYLSFACSLVTAAKRKEADNKSGNAWDGLHSHAMYQESAEKVVGFLTNWFGVQGDDCLVEAFQATKGALVHERTPTYDKLHNGSYPTVNGYYSDAYWGGDQGLIMGALKQYSHLVSTLSPKTLDNYPMELLMGVFYNMLAQDLPNAVGPYLDPSGNSPLSEDDNDYGSGSGIFWRYVMRCCRLDPGFKAEAVADAKVVSVAITSGTNKNTWGNQLFQPFNTVAAAICAWYLLK